MTWRCGSHHASGGTQPGKCLGEVMRSRAPWTARPWTRATISTVTAQEQPAPALHAQRWLAHPPADPLRCLTPAHPIPVPPGGRRKLHPTGTSQTSICPESESGQDEVGKVRSV